MCVLFVVFVYSSAVLAYGCAFALTLPKAAIVAHIQFLNRISSWVITSLAQLSLSLAAITCLYVSCQTTPFHCRMRPSSLFRFKTVPKRERNLDKRFRIYFTRIQTTVVRPALWSLRPIFFKLQGVNL